MALAAKRRTARAAEWDPAQPSLQEQVRECLAALAHNQMLFDLELEPELIEQRIYEREALNCRYRYLLRLARDMGLRLVP